MDAPNLVETLNDTEGSVVWGLYFHLWKKTHKGNPCPDINLPHTVLYQDSRPIAWYFTSLKENKIYRKKKNNMSGLALWDAFNPGKDPPCEVSSWFSGNMTRVTSTPKKGKGGKGGEGGEGVDTMYMLDPPEEDMEAASFEYLVHDRVRHLMVPGQYTMVTEQVYDGLLQKFVLPREACDSVLRVIWSPTACVCERRVNRNPLNDARTPLSDRIASFDGSQFWLNAHQQLPPGSVLVQRLGAQCDTIVKHLKETTSGKVSVARMEIFFKVDVSNRIWLLYCNSLRLDKTVLAVDRAPPMLTQTQTQGQGQGQVVRQYTLVDETRDNSDTRIPIDNAPFMCALTGQMCEGIQRCDVTYKLLIQHWFNQAAQLEGEADRIAALDNIPPAIRRANPNISRDYYLRMRSQPMFLLKTAPVSAAAAAELSAATLQDLARTISRPTSTLAQSASRVTTAETSAPDPATAAHSHSREAHQGQSGPRRLLLAQQSKRNKQSAAVAAALAEVEGDFLYQPGTIIPAALMPKPASKGNHPHNLTATRSHPTATASASARSGELLLTKPPASSTTPSPNAIPAPTSPSAAQGCSSAAIRPQLPAATARRDDVSPYSRKPPSPPTRRPPHKSATPPSPIGPRTQPPQERLTSTQPHSAVSPSQSRAAALYPSTGVVQQVLIGPRGMVATPVQVRAPGSPYLDNIPGGAKGLALTAGSRDVRSPERPSHVSNDDLKTLRALSEAYADAEAKTAQLLAQAHEVLNEPPAAATRRLSPELRLPGQVDQEPGEGDESQGANTGGEAMGAGGSRAGSRIGSGRQQHASGTGVGSRPASSASARAATGSMGSQSGGNAAPPAALMPKPGGAAAGLTSDEAAFLSEALAEA